MKLAHDRFYHSSVLFRGADGILRNVEQFTYESKDKLYDILIIEGLRFYRVNIGKLSNMISDIKPAHYAIESHFNLNTPQ